MRTNLALYMVVTAMGTTVGCSASGPLYTPAQLAEDQAVVYVYRPGQNYMGSGVALPIKVDGKKIGDLRNNGYVYGVVPPGKHIVTCTTEVKSEVPIDAEPKRSYYIEAEVQWGLFIGRPKLVRVPEETGSLAVSGTRLCH